MAPQSSSTSSSAAATGRARRARKEKPYIALAADQPPTTQGKPRTRVFVACLQCRSRKIRCDGAKPVCHNCHTRPPTGSTMGECNYDPTPKRRGPDKVQGARTRTTHPRDEQGEPPKRRRRRTTTTTAPEQPVAHLPSELFTAPPHSQGPSSHLLHSQTALPLPSFPSLQSHRDVVTDVQQNLLTLADVSQSLLDQPPHNVRYPPSATTSVFSHAFPGAPVHGHHSSDHRLQNQLDYPAFFLPNSSVPEAFITSAEEDDSEQQQQANQDGAQLGAEPSVQFSRKSWWDNLLAFYASYHHNGSQQLHLTQTQRHASYSQIITDMRILFQKSNYWFSFFNVPRFYSNFLDPVRRSMMQPSLVLAVLAVATFLQSSESGRGEAGRRMAMRLRDEAQSALDASVQARRIDESLAQAAWILAFFEISAHPHHRGDRVASAMRVLDSIVRSLALTYLDADDPQTSKYAPGSIPTIPSQSSTYGTPSSQQYFAGAMSNGYNAYNANNNGMNPLGRNSTGPNLTHHNHHNSLPSLPSYPTTSGCTCDSLSLGHHWPEASEQTPMWVSCPAWNYEWNEGEVRKEECRRLSWSCLMLAAGYSSYMAATRGRTIEMFMNNPSNYALLFPGESLTSSPFTVSNTSGKETVWALYLRAELLWNSCLRLRYDTSVREEEKGERAMKVWLETEAIDAALNRHSCGVERACLFIGREYLFNTRMCISYEFQRFIPQVIAGVARRRSEEWLNEQKKRANLFTRAMGAVTGNRNHALAERPFFVFWFMGQFARALSLWAVDHTLTIALDVCKAFLEPINFLTKLWPCPEQRRRYEQLVEQLRIACMSVEAGEGSAHSSF
ncbi:uncharacterized protein STEHIDRAFT_126004 [Stereum hirsutum FP-91666 SS1]|uniref:Zn(2)-C6 fungal-type domain-containing protein n=1 Tax=Stereum hirsutum (strain FP-91666) TaxID=721885 RepID=R7RYJ1_STEHR|nr:uncharacterized protein STEHIDRAFT_126004 [Stereum hirsutum FP-91666 SS1]EIM80476.1 hypothetical protein STEHIDRAFT_126004 [Stereum hirsutum FP-91666 SS1]